MQKTEIYVADGVRKVRRLHREIINQTTSEMTVKTQLEMVAENLFEEFQKGNSATTIEISNSHPKFIAKDSQAILDSEFGVDDAKLTIAKGYGFRGWDDLEKNGNETFDMTFELAVDTLLNGNIEFLEKQIESEPDVLKRRSKYGHKATLLHYVSSNGVEIRRQKVPQNLVEITKMLIEKGADKFTKAKLYGGEFTTLELATTSAHPTDAGIMKELQTVLSKTIFIVEIDGDGSDDIDNLKALNNSGIV